ncbi:MAG: DUF1016 N-terminal domain-containing protein [Pseudomonadota bacterium]
MHTGAADRREHRLERAHADEHFQYREELIERLALDLTKRSGRGFRRQNLQQMRSFYLFWLLDAIRQTLSGESDTLPNIASRFPFSTRHFVAAGNQTEKASDGFLSVMVNSIYG